MKTVPRRRAWAGRAFQKEEQPRQRLGTEPSTGAGGASSPRQRPRPGVVWPLRLVSGKSLPQGCRVRERQRRQQWGQCPGAGAPSPATPLTGPDTGFQRTRPQGHAPPEFTRIIQEARKSLTLSAHSTAQMKMESSASDLWHAGRKQLPRGTASHLEPSGWKQMEIPKKGQIRGQR